MFVHEDLSFGRAQISQIVAEAGCEMAGGAWDGGLLDALGEVAPPLDLIVLSFRPEAPATLEAVAEFRKQDWLSSIPVLGVASLDRSDLDFWQLRALGVAGLIDSGAPPEHVRFRIARVAYKGREGRRFERAPCCIPVDVDIGGEQIAAYAVSLSVGGMGLACSQRIEPNTPLELRFSLDDDGEPISVSGRTVHLREVRRPSADYEVGLFFHQLTEGLAARLGLTVSRLLSAWDTVGNLDFAPARAATPLQADRARRS